ncbi:ADAMTS-like protein 3 [Frankliniella fusca]|uniref:ADAMTS-like protein 3 n=1 Tax=Frankliniella fusca TaxID=407009 RepID=A0AAE1HVM3_9NEOP|nr:ADAMTS-like protein 3 [Frankliniella fusca]
MRTGRRRSPNQTAQSVLTRSASPPFPWPDDFAEWHDKVAFQTNDWAPPDRMTGQWEVEARQDDRGGEKQKEKFLRKSKRTQDLNPGSAAPRTLLCRHGYDALVTLRRAIVADEPVPVASSVRLLSLLRQPSLVATLVSTIGTVRRTGWAQVRIPIHRIASFATRTFLSMLSSVGPQADGDQEPVAGAVDVSTPAVESWTTEAVLGAAGAAANTSSSSTSGTMARMQESRRAQRLQARRQWPSSRGWSTWSDWSTCSRTCDGGASYQLRRCKSPAGCRGEAMRYKICNMQPCMDSVDFRAQQCEAWNREPRRGRFYRWTPHHDEDRPCALVCRGEPVLDTAGDAPADGDIPGDTLPRQRRRRRRGRHNRAGDRDDDDDEEEDEDDEDAGADEDGDEDEERVDAGGRPVVEVLAPKAQDGTRCRPGSLDMCINGKCQASKIP